MMFYASKTSNTINGHGYKYSPELLGRVCLNPYYKCSLVCDQKYLLDSGAFQDVRKMDRLTFKQALDRQLNFEKKVGKPAYEIVSYDWLVDEQMENGIQIKKRIDHKDSEDYVEETIKAAEYLVSKRDYLSPRNLVLSNQGTTVNQYVGCVQSILDMAQENDVIGLGGFCIISQQRKYENQFYQIIDRIFPMIAGKGIKRVHIFGVGIFRVLINAANLAKKYNLNLSYDTSAYTFSSVQGRVFNPVELEMSYVFSKKQKMVGYNPDQLSMFNLESIHNFWKRWDALELIDTFELDTNFHKVPDIPEITLDKWFGE